MSWRTNRLAFAIYNNDVSVCKDFLGNRNESSIASLFKGSIALSLGPNLERINADIQVSLCFDTLGCLYLCWTSMYVNFSALSMDKMLNSSGRVPILFKIFLDVSSRWFERGKTFFDNSMIFVILDAPNMLLKMSVKSLFNKLNTRDKQSLISLSPSLVSASGLWSWFTHGGRAWI